MSLMSAYTQIPQKTVYDTIIISHFDSHGVAFAASRYAVLSRRGEDAEVVSKFPETGPVGLSNGSIKQLLDHYAPRRYELIDIPVDVRNPDAAIKTLRELSQRAPVYFYDHHETDVPFIQRLHEAGIFASVFGDNVAMAAALELFSNEVSKYLAIVGMVADRDKSVLRIESREKVEKEYLPAANRLDVLVRNPQLVGVQTQGELAKELVRRGPHNILLYTNVEYPPERLASELQSKIVSEGQIAILVDISDIQPQLGQWIPKTLEQMLLNHGKYIAVAVAPGFNPRTRTLEGYDVRVLRYWLAPSDVPVPEDVAKELIAQAAISGNVVGHADYISIRYPSAEQAMATARTIFQRIEGMQSTVAHLVNDSIVASAVRRDFQAILEELKEIHRQMAEMYREYLELKKRQVELLERTTDERTRYD